MSHAEVQAKRLASCAANATIPKRRRMFKRLAKRWAARALETDSQRIARIEREARDYALLVADRDARRAEAAIRAARHKPRDPYPPRDVKPLKRGRLKRQHLVLSSALALLEARKTARRLKRLGLPPLPY